MAGVDKPNIKYPALNIWVPYAWDETSATTDWTCPDSTNAKEHYVLAHNYYSGIPVSSIGVVCSMYKSGIGAHSGAVVASLWVDDAWQVSSTHIKGNAFTMTAFSHIVNNWTSPSSHTISFRWRVSHSNKTTRQVTKGVNQLYDFYVKGR